MVEFGSWAGFFTLVWSTVFLGVYYKGSNHSAINPNSLLIEVIWEAVFTLQVLVIRVHRFRDSCGPRQINQVLLPLFLIELIHIDMLLLSKVLEIVLGGVTLCGVS